MEVLVTPAALLLLALATPKPVVAVFDIEARGTKLAKHVADGLADNIATGLTTSGAYTVVPRAEIQRALTTKKTESYNECYESSCQIELGKELAANKTLATTISRFGKTCQVTLKLFDLRSSTTEAGGRARGKCNDEALLASVDQALEALLGKRVSVAKTRVSPPPTEPPPPPPPPTERPPPPAPPAKPKRFVPAAIGDSCEGRDLTAMKKLDKQFLRYIAAPTKLKTVIKTGQAISTGYMKLGEQVSGDCVDVALCRVVGVLHTMLKKAQEAPAPPGLTVEQVDIYRDALDEQLAQYRAVADQMYEKTDGLACNRDGS